MVQGAGFEVERASYVNITFFAPILLGRLFMRATGRAAGIGKQYYGWISERSAGKVFWRLERLPAALAEFPVWVQLFVWPTNGVGLDIPVCPIRTEAARLRLILGQ